MGEDDSRPRVVPNYPEELVQAPPPLPGVRAIENLYVAMRDGVKLALDVFLPQAEGRYPVLLSTSPYMKDIQRKPPHWSHAIESGATSFYVPKGYVHVIAQGRGAGLSQGQWQWFGEGERTDGYDLVEWIAAQPWCSGKVGMIGDSYWSWTQYAAAIAQPPHLACICQQDATCDFYRDVCYQGGVFHHQFVTSWISYHTAMMAWPGAVEGKLPPMNLTWEAHTHPCDGPFYRERAAWTKLERIQVPVLSIAPQGGAMHFRGQLWAYARIRSPKKLLVVPPTGFWSHLRYLTDRNLNRQMLRWFDYWLKGIDNGIMREPEVAIFDPGTRAWRYENEYPLARTQWRKFYLGGNGAEPPHGRISPEAPGSEPPDRYRMPDAYARLTAAKPVLAYTTPPLAQDLRVWGPLSLTLYASSSQPDTVFFVKLADLRPDGTAARLSRGILKASFRAVDESKSGPGQPFHPFDKQELLEPGRVYELRIELAPVFHTFKAGHRLELQIASEDIEYNSIHRQVDVLVLPWPVENAVHHDARHASHLELPVVPDAPEIRPVEPPLADIAWPLVPGSWLAHTGGWPLEGD
ncbi:MAG: CocE/NonD family hydrolase [Burkholderiales bacterium]|nr:CocE/NonD family hydrolase [Burkholderiales bacterium]